MSAVEIYYPNTRDAGVHNSEVQLRRLLDRCTGSGGLAIKLSFGLYTNLRVHSTYPYVLGNDIAASLERVADDAHDDSRLAYLGASRADVDTGAQRLRFHAVSTPGSGSALPPLNHPVQKTLNLLFASGNIALGGEKIRLVPPSMWQTSSMERLSRETHVFYRGDCFMGALALHYGENFSVKGRTFYGARHPRAEQAHGVAQTLMKMTEGDAEAYDLPAVRPPEVLVDAIGKSVITQRLLTPNLFDDLLPPALQ